MKKRKDNKAVKGITISMLALALPGIIYLFIMNYVPMVGILLAFKKYNNKLGFFGSEWIGFKNFEFLFKAQDLYRIVRNTIGYNIMFIIITPIVAIAVALLLNEIISRNAIKVYQTSYFLPYFVSWVVVGFMARILFSYDTGILNQICTVIGRKPVSWYQETRPWWIILLLSHLWKSIGFNTVVYYGALMGIDKEMLEAAKIDGCTGMKTIRYITLPSIFPTVIILFILAVGNIMRSDFGLFYYLPNNTGALFSVTDVIDTYIYRSLRETGDIGITSAVSLIQAVVGLILVLGANSIVKKINDEQALI